MKTLLLSICFIIMSGIISAQESDKIVKDTLTGNDIIVGEISRAGLINIGNWFNQEYSIYVPDSVVITKLAELKENLPSIFVVLGTWCGDSKEHVPHFLKVADLIGYPANKIFMVAVDRDKKAGNFCLADFDIQLVPTFILTSHGKEIGRIIETPTTTIEQDILNIIKGQSPSNLK